MRQIKSQVLNLDLDFSAKLVYSLAMTKDIITLPDELLAHMGWDQNTDLIAIIDGDSVILKRDEDVHPEN